MFPGVAMLFGWLFGIAALGTAVVLLVGGLRRRSRPTAAAGGTLLVVLAALAARMEAVEMDEWNPSVNENALVGTWRAGESRLSLAADGSFRIDARGGVADRLRLTRAEGEWSLDDWNLSLRVPGGPVHELRVVAEDGEYRIIEQPGDLDGWRPWSGLRRLPPSPARR